jgi:hypothetical protein
LFIIQFGFFLFFPWVVVSLLMWPRVVCGSTTCHLAHLVVCVSWAGRSWHLAAREPSWFLHLPSSGDAMCRLRVWRSQFCLFSVVFPVRCISNISPRFYFRKHAFCFLPLVTILESDSTLFFSKNLWLCICDFLLQFK